MKPIIGIPKKGDDESFKEMILSLISSTTYFDKIVIATNEDLIIPEIPKDKYLILKNDYKTPLEAYNALFDYAIKERKDLFLTQTDVLFPKLYKQDWLKVMSNIASNENVGAITSLNGYGISGKDYIEGMKWLGGWCVYYPLRVLDLIGGFDKEFPNGMGVDIDHSFRLWKTGLKIVVMDYWIHHHMQNEREHDRNENSEEMKQASSQYFRQKYKLGEYANDNELI